MSESFMRSLLREYHALPSHGISTRYTVCICYVQAPPKVPMPYDSMVTV